MIGLGKKTLTSIKLHSKESVRDLSITTLFAFFRTRRAAIVFFLNSVSGLQESSKE